MTLSRYIPAESFNAMEDPNGLSRSNNQQMSNGAYQYTHGGQGPAPGPVHVVQPSSSAQYSAIPGFMQHRSNIATDVNTQQPRPIPNFQAGSQTALHSGFTAKTTDAPTGSSTFAAPHPIITASPNFQLQSFDQQQGMGMPTGGTAESSPLQPVTPYDMAPHGYSSSGRPSTALAQEQSYMPRNNMSSATGDSQQGPPGTYVYSQSPHAQTTFSMTQTNNVYFAYQQALQQQHSLASAGKPQIYRTTAPYGFVPSPNTSMGVPPHYQGMQSLSGLPLMQGMIPPSQQDSTKLGAQSPYSGQQAQGQSLPSSSVPQMTPSAGQYRVDGGGPYLAAAQMQHSHTQPVTSRPTIINTQPRDGPNATWSPVGAMPDAQINRLPPGFKHSHSRNPGFNRGGLMISEDADEKEYTGTLSYDPYMVKHRKRTTAEQLAVLEQSFEEGPKPSAITRRELAERIGMTPRSVQVWFQNRRQKKKMLAKKNLEGEQNGALTHAVAGFPASGQQPNSANAIVSPFGPDGPSRQYSQIGAGQTSQMPMDATVYSRGPQDQHHPQSGKSGVMKPTPLISQARRGSVPYPPPQSPSIGMYAVPQRPPPPPSLSRTVSSSALARAQIPLQVVPSPNPSNGRRASLPVNSHSISLGFFTPPRIGSKATSGSLGAIADDEHLLGTHVLGAIGGQEGLPAPVAGSSGTTAEANGQFSRPYGPLPNPEFSFGNSGVADRKASLTSSASFSPHIAWSVVAQGMAYRKRMDSMASTLSQATTEGASDSDWERTQQLVTPFMPSNGMHVYGDVSGDMGQGYRMDGPDWNNKQLMVPMYHDFRRASAPAELLQKFSVLDVEQQLHSTRKNRSPLTMSFTEVNEESDDRTNGSPTASPEHNRPRDVNMHSSVH